MKLLLLFFSILFIVCDLKAESWIQRSDFGGVGRHRAVSVAIGNKIYMGTGHSNGVGFETYFSDWWEYDPASNSWTQKANYAGNFGNGELGAQFIQLQNSGYVGLGELDKHSLYRYNPATNTWTEVTGPPTNVNFQDSGSFTIGNKSYFMNLNSGQIYMYDADLDNWTIKNYVPFTVYYSYAGFSINGKGYMKVYNQLWEYEPSTDSWTVNSTFPGLAKLSSMCFVQNNRAYIVCGYNSTYGDLVSEVWQFDPITDQWTQFEDFPGSSRRYSCGMTVGNRSFVGTGTNGINFNDFWEFTALAGVEEAEEEGTFELYPNPSSDKVNIRSEKYADFEVNVYELSGKKLRSFSTKSGHVLIEKENLESGMYIYHIERVGKVISRGKFEFQ